MYGVRVALRGGRGVFSVFTRKEANLFIMILESLIYKNFISQYNGEARKKIFISHKIIS